MAFNHIICQNVFLLGAAEAKREPSVTEAMKGFHAILDPHRYCQTSMTHAVIGRDSRSLTEESIGWLLYLSYKTISQ